MAIKSVEVNTLNIFLIVVSLVLAYQFPFELFILAYAILGPLHYVTEINWLNTKNYFIKDKRQVWLLVLLTLLIAGPFTLIMFSYTAEMIPKDSFLMTIRDHSPSFALTALITAIVLTFTRKWWIILAVMVGVFGIAQFFDKNIGFAIILSGLLPTILHVFAFTFFFMLYGAMKDNSKTGYFASFLMLLVPLVIIFVPIEYRGLNIADYFTESYDTAKFSSINYSLGYSIGLFEGLKPNYAIISEVGVKLQIFIAFAYTYHYLNWFSKTTVIGWHKVISKKKLVVILGIWLISLAIYFTNYYAGFVLLLFLSYLHVLMEFPLNWVSIKEVGRKIFVRT